MESRYIKNYSNRKAEASNLEVAIAKLYILFLPIRMLSQLSFLNDIFGVCANYFPFVFHVFGLLLWLVNEGGRLDFGNKDRLVKHAFGLLLYLNASSVIMAIVIQSSFGNHGSENAFQGIAGMMVYFTQYFLMFLYNYRVFQILPVKTINRELHYVCIYLLIVGYFQVLVMNGIGTGIYNRINIFGNLNSANGLAKLSLTGGEGATAGCIIGIFVLPFLLSEMIIGKKKYLLEVALWLIPLYFTFSSTAYLLAITNAVSFSVLVIVRSENKRAGLGVLTVSVISLITIYYVLTQTGILSRSVLEEIRYLMFEKALDTDNGSTVSRTVPLLVNWGAFTEYPLLGVGNGLQGYFYEKYFPDWALRASGSDVSVFLARSAEGISNAGVFIPGLLSGYGTIGCIMILIFAFRCIHENRYNRLHIGSFYYMFLLAGIAFIFMGFQGDAYGLYFAWFMLSIPFVPYKKEGRN